MIICDDDIEELNEKVKNLSEKNLELKERIIVITMFYDTFKDEMKDIFDSDEKAEKNWQVLLKKDQLEQDKFSCENFVFVSKSEACLQIHGCKKHQELIRNNTVRNNLIILHFLV